MSDLIIIIIIIIIIYSNHHNSKMNIFIEGSLICAQALFCLRALLGATRIHSYTRMVLAPSGLDLPHPGASTLISAPWSNQLRSLQPTQPRQVSGKLGERPIFGACVSSIFQIWSMLRNSY